MISLLYERFILIIPVLTRRIVRFPPSARLGRISDNHSLISITAINVFPLPVGRQTIKFFVFACSTNSVYNIKIDSCEELNRNIFT